jgi:acetoin utilization protein AcuB
MQVSEVMNRTVVTVEPDASIEVAVALVRRTGAEHILVLDEETLVGILCSCDLRGAEVSERVADRMSLPVMTLRPDVAVEEALTTLRECAVGCLPVTVGGLILGTIGEPELLACGLSVPHVHHHGRRSRPRTPRA